MTERMSAIADEDLSEAQRAAKSAFETSRGYALMGPFNVLLRSPEVMERAANLGRYLRFESPVSQALREFAILITARTWSQDFEWHHHVKYALEAGLAKTIIEELADGGRPTGMSADEAAVYQFCTELHQNKSVSDATYAAAIKAVGEQGVIDMAAISGYYTMLAMAMNVARTPPPADDGAPKLRSLP